MHWEIWGEIFMFLTFQMRYLERSETTRESSGWPGSLGRRTICDVVEIQDPMSYTDEMPVPLGQDPRKRVPPIRPIPSTQIPLQEQDRAWPRVPHTDRCSGSFFKFNIPPELGVSGPRNFSLILLSGVGCCRGDRGKFLRSRSPYFSLILESEAEGPQESLLPSS